MRILLLATLLLVAGTPAVWPAQAQDIEAEIEALTGQEWSAPSVQVLVSEQADSAFVIGSELYWVKGAEHDWVRCPTESAAFRVDSLVTVAKATLRGQSDPGINGPLNRMQECVFDFTTMIDSLQ